MESPRSLPTLPIRDKDTPGANFLYHTVPGRALLGILVRPSISRLGGWLLDRRVSRFLVAPFIRSAAIPMEDYQQTVYRSFNDFFTRQVRPGLRPMPGKSGILAAPCDGKLTAYRIGSNSVFRIKHSDYRLEELLEDKDLAEEFRGGTCLIFRLTPDDYHRYAFPDHGRIAATRKIPGVLHTVRPIAFDRYPVYLRNAREYAVLDTAHFGKVIQMEVGALFVGRILNHPLSQPFRQGQEKGMFQFGGSTVVLLLKKDAAQIHPVFFENTQNNLETKVKMGYPLE